MAASSPTVFNVTVLPPGIRSGYKKDFEKSSPRSISIGTTLLDREVDARARRNRTRCVLGGRRPRCAELTRDNRLRRPHNEGKSRFRHCKIDQRDQSTVCVELVGKFACFMTELIENAVDLARLLDLVPASDYSAPPLPTVRRRSSVRWPKRHGPLPAPGYGYRHAPVPHSARHAT